MKHRRLHKNIQRAAELVVLVLLILIILFALRS
jgi:hypothetical protein